MEGSRTCWSCLDRLCEDEAKSAPAEEAATKMLLDDEETARKRVEGKPRRKPKQREETKVELPPTPSTQFELRDENREFWERAVALVRTRDRLEMALLRDHHKCCGSVNVVDVVSEIEDVEGEALQDIEDLDKLLEVADAARVVLDTLGYELVRKALRKDPEKVVVGDYKRFTDATVKPKQRAQEKVMNDYKGDVKRLKDATRCSMVAKTPSELYRLMKILTTPHDHFELLRFKNRFNNPTFTNYADALAHVRIRMHDGSSFVVEVQVHLASLLQVDSSKIYEYFRSFRPDARLTQAIDTLGRHDDLSALYELVKDAIQKGDEDSLDALDALLGKLRDPMQVRVRQRLVQKSSRKESKQHAARLNNLADLLRDQGHYSMARPLYERAIAIDEQHISNLAELFKAQGRYDEARPLFERAVEISSRPDLARHLASLAEVLLELGDVDEAKLLYQRTIRICERPSKHRYLSKLGELEVRQGNSNEAVKLFRQSVRILTEDLGEADIALAAHLLSLARVLQGQGKFDAAKPLFKRAIEIKERELGPHHPEVAAGLSDMAQLAQARGDYEKAKVLLEGAVEINELALGPEHPAVADTLSSLAYVVRVQGGDAKSLLERSLEIKESGTTLQGLAMVYHDEGRLDEAKLLYERAITQLEGPRLAFALDGLAALLSAQGKPDEAKALCDRAVDVGEEAGNPEELAIHLNYRALVAWRVGQLDAAIEDQERATAILRSQGSVEKTAYFQGQLDSLKAGSSFPY